MSTPLKNRKTRPILETHRHETITRSPLRQKNGVQDNEIKKESTIKNISTNKSITKTPKKLNVGTKSKDFKLSNASPAFKEKKSKLTVCNIKKNDNNENEQDSVLFNNKSTKKLENVKSKSLLDSGPSLKSTFDKSSIKVAVRVRPFSDSQAQYFREIQNDSKNVIDMIGKTTFLKTPNGKDQEFTFDYSFWSFNADNSAAPYTTQEDVYRSLARPLLQCSFDGYNTCLFAYGQTGSGKSYTIMGYEEEDEGIVPRFSRDLFNEISCLKEKQSHVQYSVEISFYEIYNERIFDLLSFDETRQQRLYVREHPDYGPYVQGLTTNIVGTYQDILDWLEVGNKSRATAATGLNDKSSRSHSVFTVFLTQISTENFDGTETQLQKQSKINLIDLAGSERASKVLDDDIIRDTVTMGTRLKEGSCINKSLHTLGKVISILSDMQLNAKKKLTYIPYRDSVLTWLLKESLGGNAKTTMIATISPSHFHYPETLSTLRYAQQARSIVNRAKVNEDPKSKLIREMLAEIERLKHSQRRTGDNLLEKEVKLLREKLQETQDELATSASSRQEKLNHSDKKQKEAATHLRRSGVAFTKIEQRLPSLVNLNEDPQLAEVLLYILQEGVTVVGINEPINDQDIQLKGNLIAEQHCIFSYSNDIVTISPEGESATYINGTLISEQIVLHHGDRIVIGGEHFFRLNHPREAAKIKDQTDKKDEKKTVKDFQFAKEELLSTQNKRLEDELEEARIHAEEEAMEQIKQAQLKAEEELKKQRASFEQKLKSLQAKLDDITGKQKQTEEDQHSAQEIISQLREQKVLLEKEILSNKKKMETESLVAKQVLEETKKNHAKLICSLETEKQKIQEDAERVKKVKDKRDNKRSSIVVPLNQTKEMVSVRGLWKISLSIREANKISEKLKQNYVFSRDDLCINDTVEIRVRIQDKIGKKSCLLSIDRFDELLNRIRDFSPGGKNGKFLNEKEFTWSHDQSNYKKGRTRVSLSDSTIMSFNQSYGKMKRVTMCQQSVVESSSNETQNFMEGESHLSASTTPAESTRLSSIQAQNISDMTTRNADDSISKSEVFDTILETVTEEKGSSSIVGSLIQLIITIYADWKKITSFNNTTMNNNDSNTLNVEGSMDNTMIRIACNLKCLKDQATLLCAVHEAVGLADLKKISALFKQDALQACSLVKGCVAPVEEKQSKSVEGQFKSLVYHMVELTGALSVAAVDHISEDEDLSYIEDNEEYELCLYFLRQQNRFLTTMMDVVLATVTNGIQEMKKLQLSQTHEMSEDLVDDVMNILTSTNTLIQKCKDLMMVYADINITDQRMKYYAKECFILRQFLTSVVDYNESIINLVDHSKKIAKNCDALEAFTEIPVEVADTTKRMCGASRDLYTFLSKKKQLEEGTLKLLCECMQKFEFAGKTVRVGVAIIVQEVENDLNISGERSVLSYVQSDNPFKRNTSVCPLNRSSLDVSSLQPEMQDRFNRGGKPPVKPDLFISRYMDTSMESFAE